MRCRKRLGPHAKEGRLPRVLRLQRHPGLLRKPGHTPRRQRQMSRGLYQPVRQRQHQQGREPRQVPELLPVKVLRELELEQGRAGQKHHLGSRGEARIWFGML